VAIPQPRKAKKNARRFCRRASLSGQDALIEEKAAPARRPAAHPKPPHSAAIPQPRETKKTPAGFAGGRRS
jgi:hypothetical protein